MNTSSLSPSPSVGQTIIPNASVQPKTKAPKKKTQKKDPNAPKKLNFQNVAVFDKRFKTDIETCFSVVAKMFFSKRMGLDGTIDTSNLVNTRKYELWSYIYYLYYYNNTSIDEFASMKNTRGGLGGASAINFYNTVRDVVNNKYVAALSTNVGKLDNCVPFDIQTLAYFINYMIHKYEGDITNPIADYINELLQVKQTVGNLNSVIVRTSQNSSGNVKVIPSDRNSKGANAANVKVQVSPI